MIDVSIIARAVRAHGLDKLAFEVERREGVALPEGADPLVAAVTAVGTKYARHALDARRVADGIAALAALEE